MTGGTLAIFGLVLTALGAGISARGALISKSTAEMLSATCWDQNSNLRDSLISQSRWAAGGLCVIAIGTVFQILAIFVK